jgi:hypothetical protein
LSQGSCMSILYGVEVLFYLFYFFDFVLFYI